MVESSVDASDTLDLFDPTSGDFLSHLSPRDDASFLSANMPEFPGLDMAPHTLPSEALTTNPDYESTNGTNGTGDTFSSLLVNPPDGDPGISEALVDPVDQDGEMSYAYHDEQPSHASNTHFSHADIESSTENSLDPSFLQRLTDYQDSPVSSSVSSSMTNTDFGTAPPDLASSVVHHHHHHHHHHTIHHHHYHHYR